MFLCDYIKHNYLNTKILITKKDEQELNIIYGILNAGDYFDDFYIEQKKFFKEEIENLDKLEHELYSLLNIESYAEFLQLAESDDIDNIINKYKYTLNGFYMATCSFLEHFQKKHILLTAKYLICIPLFEKTKYETTATSVEYKNLEKELQDSIIESMKQTKDYKNTKEYEQKYIQNHVKFEIDLLPHYIYNTNCLKNSIQYYDELADFKNKNGLVVTDKQKEKFDKEYQTKIKAQLIEFINKFKKYLTQDKKKFSYKSFENMIIDKNLLNRTFNFEMIYNTLLIIIFDFDIKQLFFDSTAGTISSTKITTASRNPVNFFDRHKNTSFLMKRRNELVHNTNTKLDFNDLVSLINTLKYLLKHNNEMTNIELALMYKHRYENPNRKLDRKKIIDLYFSLHKAKDEDKLIKVINEINNMNNN